MKKTLINLLPALALLLAGAPGPAAGECRCAKSACAGGACRDKASCPATKPNTLSSCEKENGWKLLFNGNDLDGWRGAKTDVPPASGWIVRDGELTILSKKELAKRPGDLVTRGIYKDFILEAEFKLTRAANSGIKYFYDSAVNGGTTLEYQVLDDNHSDAKRGRDGNRRVASFYDVMPAVGAEPAPLGQWNKARIVSRGSHVEHWLNGKKVLSFERGSEAFREAVSKSKFAKWPKWGETPAGRILLQDHHDHVSYRNIKIKTLD